MTHSLLAVTLDFKLQLYYIMHVTKQSFYLYLETIIIFLFFGTVALFFAWTMLFLKIIMILWKLAS